jgi:prepilin-type processing-associated H-X9-DG protein
LGIAFIHYYEHNYETFPNPEKWSDLLLEDYNIPPEQFTCPLDKKNKCSFAFNIACSPNSPPDTVLLFESKGGWNLQGGKELCNTKNHKTGCNILFIDGHVEFVKTEDINGLNWNGHVELHIK